MIASFHGYQGDNARLHYLPLKWNMLAWQKWLNKFRRFRISYLNWSSNSPLFHSMSTNKVPYSSLPIQLKKDAPNILKLQNITSENASMMGKSSYTMYIPTNEQVADTFTKNLTWQRFEANWKMLQLISYSVISWIARWSVEVLLYVIRLIALLLCQSCCQSFCQSQYQSFLTNMSVTYILFTLHYISTYLIW